MNGMVRCDYCRKWFYYLKQGVLDEKAKKVFCSKICQYEYHTERKAGE